MTYTERTRLKRMRTAIGMRLYLLCMDKLPMRLETRHRTRLIRLEQRVLVALRRD